LQILRKPAEFSALLQARRRVSLPLSHPQSKVQALLELYAQHRPIVPTDSSPIKFWRLGMVISRKAAPLAVQRNWLKRQIRVICQEQENAEPIDLVFRARLELKKDYLVAKQKRQLRYLRDRIRAEVGAYLSLVKK
jgi:ribonuclease P protein component